LPKIYTAFRNPGLFKNVVTQVIRRAIAKSEVPDKSGNLENVKKREIDG